VTGAQSPARWGISGDTSCGDYNVALCVRKALDLDKVPTSVTDKANDAIIYDVDATGKSGSGYGHPRCGHGENTVAKEIGWAPAAANNRRYLRRTRESSARAFFRRRSCRAWN